MKRLNRKSEIEPAAEKHPPLDDLHPVHRKEFEFQGCVEVPMELSEDQFLDLFLAFIEANHWSFGGGMRTIVDGCYLNADGTPGEPVWPEEDEETGPCDAAAEQGYGLADTGD